MDPKFETIYEDILHSSKDELEELRKNYIHHINMTIVKMIGSLVSVVIFVILGIKMESTLLLNVGPFVAILFCVVSIIRSNNPYKSIYKEMVIKRFINAYDKTLTYTPDRGIRQQFYEEAEFERFNRYHSEDLIEWKSNGYYVGIAEVHTEEGVKDPNGNTNYHTVFHGVFSVSNLKKTCTGIIKIRSDQGVFGKFLNRKQRIEMDSEEFEKYFEVLADNKIEAMQILTSDVMDCMIEFVKKYKIPYEITVKLNRIYIRFHTSAVFEANILKSSVDFNTLKEVYDITHFTFDITKAFIKAIEETEL